MVSGIPAEKVNSERHVEYNFRVVGTVGPLLVHSENDQEAV